MRRKSPRNPSAIKEATLVPEAPDWHGPICRVLCCSDDVEETMRPPNPFFLQALAPQGMWIYTIDGYVEYEQGDQKLRVGPGQALAVRQPAPGTLVYHRQGLPWRRIYIGFTGEAALGLFDYVVQQFGSLQALPMECDAVRGAQRFCKMVLQQPVRPARFWSVLAYRWLNSWWASCEDARPGPPQLVNLSANFPGLIPMSHGSVKEFADRMGYSRSYLSRRLKTIWRRNPSEVLRHARFEEAMRLLRETRLPVSEVAKKSGFSSSSAFCASFKTHMGKTPLNYRHEHIEIR